MSLGIPYVYIWTILHMDLSGATPVCVFPWPHETTQEAHSRNIAGVKQLQESFAPAADSAKIYAENMDCRLTGMIRELLIQLWLRLRRRHVSLTSRISLGQPTSIMPALSTTTMVAMISPFLGKD